MKEKMLGDVAIRDITLIGVVNVTPDSFSDGGQFLNPDAAYEQAQSLLQDGANLIDLGADSTRPGSSCVGVELELKRLTPILKLFAEERVPFAVDTHHVEVAEVALEFGASMINDISGGQDDRMLELLADSPVNFVLMHSRCPAPHNFCFSPAEDLISHINLFFRERIAKAASKGIAHSRLILDPGLGRFISSDPNDSWRIIRNFLQFTEYGLPLYLGASRKGFLQLPFEKNVRERDLLSAYVAEIVSCSLPREVPLYIRTHNISAHIALSKIAPVVA